MKFLLGRQKTLARRRGYKHPNITPEDLILMWEQQEGRCAWTDEPITPLTCHLEHNHDTGKFRGFVKPYANAVEGHLSKLTPEGQAKLLARVFPDVVRQAYELLASQD